MELGRFPSELDLGVGNNTFVALLVFVPFVNVVIPFVLGAKGSSWAWRNKKWDSVDAFKAVQRKWAKWGAIIWGSFVVFFVALFFLTAASFKSSGAFKLAVDQLERSEQASQLLGKPLSTGMPMGNIDVSGPSGNAKLSFSVEGPSGKGTVYVDAAKDLGQWKINRMVLEQEGTGRRVDLTE